MSPHFFLSLVRSRSSTYPQGRARPGVLQTKRDSWQTKLIYSLISFDSYIGQRLQKVSEHKLYLILSAVCCCTANPNLRMLYGS